MISLTSYLEDFGTATSGLPVNSVSDEMLETERLEAFDKGYRAGWDDAIKAKTDEGTQLSDGVAQNLQDLSFTYHEVHAQILSNLTPLFNEILQKMLPVLARDTLGAHIADQLSQISRNIGAAQVKVVVAPGAGEHVRQLVNAASTSLPIDVTESSSIGEGQADIQLGSKELSIDLADVSAQITQAVHAVLYEQAEVRTHG